ncbi:hypothetical protein ACFU9B_39415 [Streptomyces sp. NPDC057592]|uniref:hypothetical protein n=1 Tax=unclassified Streptomyces TaxID=2593676 RepID=UPI0036AE2BF4
MPIDTTTEPVLPPAQEEQGEQGPYCFDLTTDTDPFVPARLALALRLVVGFVSRDQFARATFAWTSDGRELKQLLLQVVEEAATHTYDDFLNTYVQALLDEQQWSVTPEWYATVIQYGPEVAAKLTDAEFATVSSQAGAYARAARKPCTDYSEAQYEAAGGIGVCGLRAAYYRAWVEWARTAQYTGDKEGENRRGRIEPAPYTEGQVRVADPGNDSVLVKWDLVGGSDQLSGWRADGHLVVDIAPVPNSTDVKVTARVRGVGVTRADGDTTWHRSPKYSAWGELKLQARDVNGAFSVVVRDQAKASLEAGTEPAEPCSLTFTVPRAKLIDHALDWVFGANEIDGDVQVIRGSVSGRRVLMIPPPLDDYRPGTVRDPASGERQGNKPDRSTPLDHTISGYATLSTKDAGDGKNTVVTADVKARVNGVLGGLFDGVDISFTSVLEKYDASTDTWRSAGSKSTVKKKVLLATTVSPDTLTVTVPTAELNFYRYKWAARDTYSGGSGVEGLFFPLWKQP